MCSATNPNWSWLDYKTRHQIDKAFGTCEASPDSTQELVVVEPVCVSQSVPAAEEERGWLGIDLKTTGTCFSLYLGVKCVWKEEIFVYPSRFFQLV